MRGEHSKKKKGRIATVKQVPNGCNNFWRHRSKGRNDPLVLFSSVCGSLRFLHLDTQRHTHWGSVSNKLTNRKQSCVVARQLMPIPNRREGEGNEAHGSSC